MLIYFQLGDPKSKYLKPALTLEPDETSEVSRISLDSTFGDLKNGKLTFFQILKKEFSYCICLKNPNNPSKEEHCQKLSGKNLIGDDPISSTSFGASTNLFTWTPLLQRKPTLATTTTTTDDSSRLSFNRIQRLTLRRGMYFYDKDDGVDDFNASSTPSPIYCLLHLSLSWGTLVAAAASKKRQKT